MSISVLILTRNEEQDLPGCLASVAWSDDVHVLDSESSDRTVDIAREHGAQVSIRPFDDYARQRNHGLHELEYRHEWLLILDADERVAADFQQRVQEAMTRAGPEIAGFRLRRRDHLFGRVLAHVQASPFYIRLVRPQRVAYTERIVNEVLTPLEGSRILDLPVCFDHHPFSKGFDHWFAKHNRYSQMEAEQIARDRREQTPFSIWKAFVERDFNRRRFHQKELFYRLPFRPTLRFCILYFLKCGFLDGYAGLTYAQMQACYERMIVCKQRELAWRQKQGSAEQS